VRQAGGDPLVPAVAEHELQWGPINPPTRHFTERPGQTLHFSSAGSSSGQFAKDATSQIPLLPDWDRHGICRRAYQLMNAAHGGVLDRFGFRVQLLGTDGAWLVADHRDKKTGAGR